MTVALGLLFGIGLLLVASPVLWPRHDRPARRGRSVFASLGDRLRQAGLGQVSAPAVVAVSVLFGIAVAAITTVLTPVLAIAVVAGLAAAALPFAIISSRARARRRAARAVWPDAIDHLVSGLRSGLSLADSLCALAGTGPAPIRPAFARFDRELAATGDLTVALDELKERLADPVADRIVETLRLARDVGGTELPTVLRNLAGYVRVDAAVRSEVEARQSWVVAAARLGVAAPWIVLLLLASRPEAVAAYNTPAGMALLGAGFVVTVVAYRIMMALGRLPEERRWFA